MRSQRLCLKVVYIFQNTSSNLAEGDILELSLLHWFIAKSVRPGYTESFAEGSLLISRKFSIVSKFNNLLLSLLLRIRRNCGTCKDCFGFSLEFTSHYWFSLGLTPQDEWTQQCRATPGVVHGVIPYRKRKLERVRRFWLPAWICVPNDFVRRINTKLNV